MSAASLAELLSCIEHEHDDDCEHEHEHEHEHESIPGIIRSDALYSDSEPIPLFLDAP